METAASYLERKHQELRLLNSCLRNPLAIECPGSVAEVIRHKFQLTAALRAEHELYGWALTETSWSAARHRTIGPFEFSYDYQRADLDVSGPSFYELDDSGQETIYTASGMAAISALLLASTSVVGRADILVLPGSYGETLELVEHYVCDLRRVTLQCPLSEVCPPTGSPQIFLLDSCVSARAFEATLRSAEPAIDLLIFDTTCFSGGSIHVRRVLRWAQKWDIPVVMVRSHTKLDSLGAEYGRLGSAVFINWEINCPSAEQSKFKALPAEMRNAVRLLGGAPLPAHFPPYIGTSSYRELTNKRVAAILRNGHRTGQYFRSALTGLTSELRFAHGLYITLCSTQPLGEATARFAAEAMSDDLSRAGLPICHAGSFGFDFAATEWFHDATTDRYSVRLAVPDLPAALWDELSQEIAQWWIAHQPICAAA